MKNDNEIKILLIFLFFLFVIFFSWKRNYKLPAEAFSYIPYKKGEVLVFKSNKNKFDTIFIKGMDRYTSPNDPLDIFPIYEETFGVCSSIYNGNSCNDGLAEIHATQKKGVIFEIRFHAYFSFFYGKNSFTIKELNNMPYKSISIKDRKYDDIWIFKATEREYEKRDDFIEKLYWSKSYGAIRYDKKNDEYWELISKEMVKEE